MRQMGSFFNGYPDPFSRNTRNSAIYKLDSRRLGYFQGDAKFIMSCWDPGI